MENGRLLICMNPRLHDIAMTRRWRACRRAPVKYRNNKKHGQKARCEDTCRCGASSFAGVEHGNQCWCGSYVGGNWASDQASCSLKCTGDGETFCGGSGFLSIFKAEENQEAVSATVSTTATGTENASDTAPATAAVSSAAANKLGVIVLSGGFWRLQTMSLSMNSLLLATLADTTNGIMHITINCEKGRRRHYLQPGRAHRHQHV